MFLSDSVSNIDNLHQDCHAPKTENQDDTKTRSMLVLTKNLIHICY